MEPDVWTDADDAALAAETATLNGQVIRLTVATRAVRVELARSWRRLGVAWRSGWRRGRAKVHGVQRCPHGRIMAYDAEARPGDVLPEIEGCPVCSGADFRRLDGLRADGHTPNCDGWHHPITGHCGDCGCLSCSSER